jgi:hypothetical protein
MASLNVIRESKGQAIPGSNVKSAVVDTKVVGNSSLNSWLLSNYLQILLNISGRKVGSKTEMTFLLHLQTSWSFNEEETSRCCFYGLEQSLWIGPWEVSFVILMFRSASWSGELAFDPTGCRGKCTIVLILYWSKNARESWNPWFPTEVLAG